MGCDKANPDNPLLRRCLGSPKQLTAHQSQHLHPGPPRRTHNRACLANRGPPPPAVSSSHCSDQTFLVIGSRRSSPLDLDSIGRPTRYAGPWHSVILVSALCCCFSTGTRKNRRPDKHGDETDHGLYRAWPQTGMMPPIIGSSIFPPCQAAPFWPRSNRESRQTLPWRRPESAYPLPPCRRPAPSETRRSKSAVIARF